MANKKKNSSIPFFKYLTFVMVLLTAIILGLFKFIDVLPNDYFLVLAVLLILITIVFSWLILGKKGMRRKVIGTLFSLIYTVLLILFIVYELNTLGFLKKLGFVNYKTEDYKVIVLNDEKYDSLRDIDNKKIGFINYTTDGLDDVKAKINKRIDISFLEYEDLIELKEGLINKEVDALLIEDTIFKIMLEDDLDFSNSYKVLDDFLIDVKTDDITKKVDITQDSFNIYISGIDTYGSVSSVSRSDVNLVVSINPKKKEALISSIPRDYYVTLKTKNALDKLTHAGIYGIDESVKAVEELLNLKINYYVKVNFSSLIKIVDILGGVDVYSEYDFTSKDGYTYKKGYNKVDGEKALSFVRERQAFSSGDRVRIVNQMRMMEAIIDKITSPSVIIKYNKILDSLDEAFITNLKMNDLTKFVKMQIDKNIKWKIEEYTLTGTDDYQYTYSVKNMKTYVMQPNKESVEEAKNKIKKVLND